MQVPIRLRTVLGPDTSTIDEARIAGLLGWREDTDLDFKQDLDRTPKGRGNLVSDIAAMANARGGVIVVGIREEDTQAVELAPLQRSEQREDRTEIFQAVAELLSPSPTLDVQQVDAEDGGYFLVLIVARIGLGPHALRRPGTHDLRYPVREGTRTRYLAEPELADRYRDRFRQAGALIDRLQQVRAEGEEVLQRSDDAQGWLLLALVPETPGRFDIDAQSPRQITEWVKDLLREVSPIEVHDNTSIRGSVAFRRVVVGEWRDDRPAGVPMNLHCQLHTDGSGFFAEWCSFVMEADRLRGYRPALPTSLAENERRTILVTTVEQMFDKVVVGLSTLARHALDRCGADGDAVVSVGLLSTGRIEAPVTASLHVTGLRQTPGTHELQRAFTSEHTLPLRTVHTPTAEMMNAVRLLMTDLLSQFGQAGVEHIRDDGSLVPDRFRSDLTSDRISTWSGRWGIPAGQSEDA